MKLAPMSEGAEETFKGFLAEAYAYSPRLLRGSKSR